MKLKPIPQETIDSVVNGTAWETDTYRIVYSHSFYNMNNQAMSLGTKAREALSKGNVDSAKNFLGEAHKTIETHERLYSGVFVQDLSGIKKYIMRIEKLL